MNILHCLPTLDKSGFGITTVVKALTKDQVSRQNCIYYKTTCTPIEPSIPSTLDIIHQHGLWVSHGFDAFKFSSKFNAPILIAPHGHLDPWALKKSFMKKKIAWFLYQRQLLKRAHCLQATSAFEVSYFRGLGLRNFIAQIPNGVDPCEFTPTSNLDDNHLLREYPFLSSRRSLLFLSRITPQKGVLNLLIAFSRCIINQGAHDWVLLLAGSDQNNYLAHIRNVIIDLDLEDYVVILPPLYGSQKRDAFALAEAFILPSLSEGFPMVVLEAMSSGLPVICTHASPWSILHEQNAGFWVQPSPSGLESALSSIFLSSPETLIKMGLIARDIILKGYTIDFVSRQLHELYLWMLDPSTSLPQFVLQRTK